MKNKVILIIVILFVFATFMKAQQAIKIAPLGVLFNYYNVAYEKAIGAQSSLQVSTHYLAYRILDNNTKEFGCYISYRYYFRQAISGGYFSPEVGYRNQNNRAIITSNENSGFSLFNIGATIGYQWVGYERFVADMGFGLGYNTELSKDIGLIRNMNEFCPKLIIKIGYSF